MAGDRHQPERRVTAMILGNPAMIDAYQAGIPANGQRVPDGAKMAKVHWTPKPNRSSRIQPGRRPAERGFHDEGQQEIRGQRRVGIRGVRLRFRVRYVQARDHSRYSATGERREVRVYLPHKRQGERLRVHGIRKAMKRHGGGAPGSLRGRPTKGDANAKSAAGFRLRVPQSGHAVSSKRARSCRYCWLRNMTRARASRGSCRVAVLMSLLGTLPFSCPLGAPKSGKRGQSGGTKRRSKMPNSS